MKFSSFALVAAFAAQEVAAHATFQELWINGVDQGGVCARLPTSNSPVQDVTSNNLRCNINTPASGKCAVKAGDTVTIEMHQQPGDRSCSEQAIGGAHYGPVLTYMSKVSDSSTADGSTGWFKVFQDTWAKAPGSSTGSDDYWGTKDLNNCCGKMDVKIPAGLPSGDYLLRAEAIALHAASSSGGAQFYMTCFQLTVTGSGSDAPATVLFPGAYKASDPGILINIYQSMSSYTAPGPDVVSDGTTKVAGSSYCPAAAGGSGAPTSSVATSPATTTTKATTTVATTMKTSTTTTTSAKTTTTSSGGSTGGNCAAKYAQCGGSGWTGATCCASGSTCTASNQYYSQCL